MEVKLIHEELFSNLGNFVHNYCLHSPTGTCQKHIFSPETHFQPRVTLYCHFTGKHSHIYENLIPSANFHLKEVISCLYYVIDLSHLWWWYLHNLKVFLNLSAVHLDVNGKNIFGELNEQTVSWGKFCLWNLLAGLSPSSTKISQNALLSIKFLRDRYQGTTIKSSQWQTLSLRLTLDLTIEL